MPSRQRKRGANVEATATVSADQTKANPWDRACGMVAVMLGAVVAASLQLRGMTVDVPVQEPDLRALLRCADACERGISHEDREYSIEKSRKFGVAAEDLFNYFCIWRCQKGPSMTFHTKHNPRAPSQFGSLLGFLL